MNAPPVLKTGKQKLVTIYVDNMAYASGKMLVGSFADKHGTIEEHLETYLQQGWRIGAIHGFGGNSDALAVRGWFAVVLEITG
ncbi:MAG: hypothetical protein RIS76_1589 [Verrucomicrobiota bacterium]|jgi:hypothetical protein